MNRDSEQDPGQPSPSLSPSPVRLGDVLGTGFKIWGRNFVRFALLGLMAFLPLIVLFVVMYGKKASLDRDDLVATQLWGMGKGVLLVLMTAVLQAPIIRLVLGEVEKRPVTIGESFSAALPRMLPVFGIAALVSIPIAFGYACLILPGLVLQALWWIAIPICVMEGKGVFESLSMSWNKVKACGSFWTIVGILAILTGIQIVVGIPLGFAQVDFKLGTPPPVVGWAEFANIVWGIMQATIAAVGYHRLRIQERFEEVFD